MDRLATYKTRFYFIENTEPRCQVNRRTRASVVFRNNEGGGVLQDTTALGELLGVGADVRCRLPGSQPSRSQLGVCYLWGTWNRSEVAT